MDSESIIIARDWRTGRIVYCKPTPFGWFEFPDLNTATDWDGRGFATIHNSVMQDRLFDREPELGDVIEVDGRSLVIVGSDPYTQTYRALTESPEAHQLVLFLLVHRANYAAWKWPIRAFERLNQHFIQDVQNALMQGVV